MDFVRSQKSQKFLTRSTCDGVKKIRGFLMDLHSLKILTRSTYDNVCDSVTKSISITAVLLFITTDIHAALFI